MKKCLMLIGLGLLSIFMIIGCADTGASGSSEKIDLQKVAYTKIFYEVAKGGTIKSLRVMRKVYFNANDECVEADKVMFDTGVGEEKGEGRFHYAERTYYLYRTEEEKKEAENSSNTMYPPNKIIKDIIYERTDKEFVVERSIFNPFDTVLVCSLSDYSSLPEGTEEQWQAYIALKDYITEKTLDEEKWKERSFDEWMQIREEVLAEEEWGKIGRAHV